MWDLKLFLFEICFTFHYQILVICNLFTNLFNLHIMQGLFLINWFSTEIFFRNVTFFFTLKFVIAIMFLVLIRGGTPRYRYDYLTKLGWLKFLGFVIAFFLISLLFSYLY